MKLVPPSRSFRLSPRRVWIVFSLLALAAVWSSPALAQQSQPGTRQAAIEQEQAQKAANLRPYVPSKAEQILDRFDQVLVSGARGVHPYFDSAYAGGGLALGVGYIRHIGSYNTIDFRGSYSIKQYKRAEVEFIAPRLFNRRAKLSLLGGWREATQVGFYGIGSDTRLEDRSNYLFEQPYAALTFAVAPTRRFLTLRAGYEWSRWSQRPGQGAFSSVERVYTPASLPGLGSSPTYGHSHASVGFDWRPSPGYARRGGFYGITGHDYRDNDEAFGFQQVDYEVVQHLPILREAWVISLRGRVQTAFEKDGQQIPFFMLPSVGGGHSLRGFSSWRFRDMNSILVQGEWRIMVNRYMDTAFFYDAGKVTRRRSDLNLSELKHNYGFGVRLHAPFVTLLRMELAKSHEGLAFIFTTGPIF